MMSRESGMEKKEVVAENDFEVDFVESSKLLGREGTCKHNWMELAAYKHGLKKRRMRTRRVVVERVCAVKEGCRRDVFSRARIFFLPLLFFVCFV